MCRYMILGEDVLPRGDSDVFLMDAVGALFSNFYPIYSTIFAHFELHCDDKKRSVESITLHIIVAIHRSTEISQETTYEKPGIQETAPNHLHQEDKHQHSV